MRKFSLTFLSILLVSLVLTAAAWLSGTNQVIAYVASSYGVSLSAVSLQAPNVVQVQQGMNNISGTAVFNGCGDLCTELTKSFPDRTLQFIVEDDLHGF